MYLPPAFREDDIEVQHELIRRNPLGVVITSGPGGLMANLIPCLLVRPEAGTGCLRFHVSRANPQANEFRNVSDCLVVFQGAQSYITPSWYPTKLETGKVVPTWNYETVHVWGNPRLIEDEAWLRAHLEHLTASQEALRSAPWKPDDAPHGYITAQMHGIIGVELTVTRIEGKWKVSQNRSEADRKGVIGGLASDGSSKSAAMSALVRERDAAL